MNINLTIKGMHCKSCVMIVQDALETLGAKKIVISLDEKKKIGKLACEHASKDAIVTAVKSEGYEVI